MHSHGSKVNGGVALPPEQDWTSRKGSWLAVTLGFTPLEEPEARSSSAAARVWPSHALLPRPWQSRAKHWHGGGWRTWGVESTGACRVRTFSSSTPRATLAPPSCSARASTPFGLTTTPPPCRRGPMVHPNLFIRPGSHPTFPSNGVALRRRLRREGGHERRRTKSKQAALSRQ